MQKCWSQDPKARPVITDIVQELEDISNAERSEAVQAESSSSSNMVSKPCDNFHIKHLSVHQGYVLEIAGERTADAMRKHKKIPEVTMAFSSPEAALLLVSTKNRDLWPGPTTFLF